MHTTEVRLNDWVHEDSVVGAPVTQVTANNFCSLPQQRSQVTGIHDPGRHVCLAQNIRQLGRIDAALQAASNTHWRPARTRGDSTAIKKHIYLARQHEPRFSKLLATLEIGCNLQDVSNSPTDGTWARNLSPLIEQHALHASRKIWSERQSCVNKELLIDRRARTFGLLAMLTKSTRGRTELEAYEEAHTNETSQHGVILLCAPVRNTGTFDAAAVCDCAITNRRVLFRQGRVPV